jgi:hypothetical protein
VKVTRGHNKAWGCHPSLSLERDPQTEVLLSKTWSSIVPLPWRQLQPLELSSPDQSVALVLRQSIPITVTDYNHPPVKFLPALSYGLYTDNLPVIISSTVLVPFPEAHSSACHSLKTPRRRLAAPTKTTQ